MAIGLPPNLNALSLIPTIETPPILGGIFSKSPDELNAITLPFFEIARDKKF